MPNPEAVSSGYRGSSLLVGNAHVEARPSLEDAASGYQGNPVLAPPPSPQHQWDEGGDGARLSVAPGWCQGGGWGSGCPLLGASSSRLRGGAIERGVKAAPAPSRLGRGRRGGDNRTARPCPRRLAPLSRTTALTAYEGGRGSNSSLPCMAGSGQTHPAPRPPPHHRPTTNILGSSTRSRARPHPWVAHQPPGLAAGH